MHRTESTSSCHFAFDKSAFEKSFGSPPTRNGNVKYKSSKNASLIRFLITFAQAQRRFPPLLAFVSTRLHRARTAQHRTAQNELRDVRSFVPLRPTERQLIFFAIYFPCSQWSSTDKQLIIITSLIILSSNGKWKNALKSQCATTNANAARAESILLAFVICTCRIFINFGDNPSMALC